MLPPVERGGVYGVYGVEESMITGTEGIDFADRRTSYAAVWWIDSADASMIRAI